MMYVIWTAIAGVLAAILLYIDYLLNSMKEIDRMEFEGKLYLRPSIVQLLSNLNKSDIMRPKKVYRVTYDNGFELLLPRREWAVSAKEALTLDYQSDDIIVSSFPKSGTTWIQEITWLICNNSDTVAAKKCPLQNRFPFLEMASLSNNSALGIKVLEKWPKNKQRLIKTHLPFETLPVAFQAGKCKVIYIARNPKDVCVSLYYFGIINAAVPHPGNWSTFLDSYCSGEIIYGSWFSHVKEYWKKIQENKSWIYFTTYEDLTKDLRGQIISISKFLEKNLTDPQIDVIAKHCTFESMSKNKSTNYSHLTDRGPGFKNAKFMRKGKVGDWKNYFTLNQNEAFDNLYEENMRDNGLDFKFEL
ncbi:sulfotransferase 1B1-like isoform X1 [Styela clava]